MKVNNLTSDVQRLESDIQLKERHIRLATRLVQEARKRNIQLRGENVQVKADLTAAEKELEAKEKDLQSTKARYATTVAELTKTKAQRDNARVVIRGKDDRIKNARRENQVLKNAFLPPEPIQQTSSPRPNLNVVLVSPTPKPQAVPTVQFEEIYDSGNPSDKGNITFVVKDENGNPIDGTLITLESETTKPLTRFTSGSGDLRVRYPKGFYRLKAYHSDRKLKREMDIEIQPSSQNEIGETVEVTLTPTI